MKIGAAFALVALGGLLSVAAVALFPKETIAPGALKPGHQSFAANCLACHAPFQGPSAQKCRACHLLDADPARFHAALQTQECVACHSDHEGVKPYRAPVRFSHALLREEARRDCRSCHARP